MKQLLLVIIACSFFCGLPSYSLTVDHRLSLKGKIKLLVIKTTARILPKTITIGIPMVIFTAGAVIGGSLISVAPPELKYKGVILIASPLIALGTYLIGKQSYKYYTKPEHCNWIKRWCQNRKNSRSGSKKLP